MMRSRGWSVLQRGIASLALACLVGVGVARADDASAPAPDKSGFTLFNPTPTADLRPLCTDRPTKSTAPCTVDAGHWQIESDVYNFTEQTVDGVSFRSELFTTPPLKLGLTNTLDFEVNIIPYQRLTIRDRATGVTTRADGIGDL